MAEHKLAPQLRYLDSREDMRLAEKLQTDVWGAGEPVVPSHLLLASVRAGGVLIGAFSMQRLVGFVYSFPGFERKPNGLEWKHCSHMLGVHPDFTGSGIGFQLKRAQWQMVRQQGFERITWTYDPLLSLNSHLNITRLGAICKTYIREYYGEMEDDLNQGMPSDRLQVDLYVNSPRVMDRMGRKPRGKLELGDYFSAGAEILNPTKIDEKGWPLPPANPWTLSGVAAALGVEVPDIRAPFDGFQAPPFYLVEIPPDFYAMKAANRALALRWRLHIRELFEDLFGRRYLITDFIHIKGESMRSFYVFSDGERRLGAFRKDRKTS